MTYNVNFDIELKENPYPGIYIALEGIDGSGKTTQVEKLAEYYRSQGKDVVVTHEPRRDGAMGALVDAVLKGDVKIPVVAIQYLFAAQRAAFMEEVIIPALKEGKVVITDRCFWSSIPYGLLDKHESEKSNDPYQLMAAMSVLSMYHEFIAPDFTVILDVSVNTAGERLTAKGKKAEIYEKREKLEKLKEGYAFLLENFSDALVQVDGEGAQQEVSQRILEIVTKDSSKAS